MANLDEVARLVAQQREIIPPVMAEVNKVIIGQQNLLDKLLISLLADGHILVEGVPGLAKTTAVNTLAKVLQAKFQRMQFTPDLLPADLIGTQIYSPKDGTFQVKKGPVFANIVLADEINRAPAKVQSALLEAMQEKQVTIGENTYPLPKPFIVMATQNPIEQEGTYNLPEAQVDRFMLKVLIDYPKQNEEIAIMKRLTAPQAPQIKPLLTPAAIENLRQVVETIFVDEKIYAYVANLVFATRTPEAFGLSELRPLIEYGAGPRASINLIKAAKAQAFLEGRAYVTPQDIKAIGPDVLRHRILVSYEAEAQDLNSDDILIKIFNRIDVP